MAPRIRRISRPAVVLRWLGVAVVVAIAIGYVQPIRALLDARSEVAERRAERAALVERKERLERRLARAGSDAFVVQEARRIGLVEPGERLYVVKGVERFRDTRGR